MSRIRIAGLAAVALCATLAWAANVNVTTKKLGIKDNADPAKRQLQVQSNDPTITYAGAVSPDANGASLHAYSATDDLCVLLPGGPDWQNTGTLWKFKSMSTKNTARISNSKLQFKIKNEPPPTYTLSDNGTQGTVNVQVQFGSGTRYCMKCTGTGVVKDVGSKFLGKNCVAAACDAEPGTCEPPPTTTTTSTSTTSTTCPTPAPPLIKGSLTATVGRFNYNLQLGLPGANAACSTNFACSHACTYTELQTAETNGELVGLKDTANNTVTSFWAIDPSANAANSLATQCADDATFPNPVDYVNHKWEYGTAHTPSRGQKVALNNPAGTLGPLQTMQACAIGGTSNWVGCCR